MAEFSKKMYDEKIEKEGFSRGYAVEVAQFISIEKKGKEDGVIYREDATLKLRNVENDREYDVQKSFKSKSFNLMRTEISKKDGTKSYEKGFDYDKSFYSILSLAMEAGCPAEGISDLGLYPSQVWEDGKLIDKDVLQYSNLIKGMKGKPIGVALRLVQKYPRKLVNGFDLVPVPRDNWSSAMREPENVWIQDTSIKMGEAKIKFKPIFIADHFYDLKTYKTFDELTNGYGLDKDNNEIHIHEKWLEWIETADKIETLKVGDELSKQIKEDLKRNFKIAGEEYNEADVEFDHSSIMDDESVELYDM